jgi:HK97 family phage portal protein
MLQRLKNALWALRQAPEDMSRFNLPLNEWLSGLDIGPETQAGVRVTEASGTRQATVYACINILSRDMSALPLKMYERKANGGRVEVEGHPVSHWLKSPNPAQTPMQWRMRGWYSTLATGNQFDEVIRSGDGEIRTIPLDPARVCVRVSADLTKRYEYQRLDGKSVVLRSEQVFHNYGLSTDGFVGISPIRHLMETIGWAIAVEQYGAAYFRSPVPKVILQHPGEFKSAVDREKFVEAWKEKFAGGKGLSSVAVLPNGMTVGQIVKVPNDEAQFIETQKLTKEQLAQIYLVPMHRLNALDRATFSNIEHQGQEYVQYSLLPWLTAQEQAIERQFLTPEEREKYFVRHNVDALLRGDFKARMEGYASGIQWSGMTPNERRALENLPAVEGGDDLLVPLNMVKLKDLKAPEEEPAESPNEPAGDDEPEEDDDARALALNRRAGIKEFELRAAQGRRAIANRYIPRLKAALQRELIEEGAAIRAQLGALLREKRDVTQFWQWLTEFYLGRSRDIRRAVEPTFQQLGSEIAEQAGAEAGIEFEKERVERFAARLSTTFSTTWAARSVEELKESAAEAEAQGQDPIEAVEAKLNQWEEGSTPASEGRAGSTARYEAFYLANALARTIFVAVGYSLVWATFGKSCAYCRDMAGKRVRGSEDFLPAGEFSPKGAEKPLKLARGVRQPPLHRGCDCMVVPG